MGNIGSSSGARGERRRRGSGHNNSPRSPISSHPPPTHPQYSAASGGLSSPEMSGNRYVFAAPSAASFSPHYQNPGGPVYYQYPGFHPPPPPAVSVPLPAPFDHPGHPSHHQNWVGAYVPPAAPHHHAFPSVKRQKAVTIRNDVNLKKETLRMEPDEHNPGRFLVAFTFDATVTGNISIFFFAREGADCSLTPTNASLPGSFSATFKEGIGQKFRQPSGSGISLSALEEAETLLKAGEAEVYPLAVKAEGRAGVGRNALITQAALEKRDGGGCEVRVVKQILWVDGTRYELQEIYGIGNSVESDLEGSDPGKECVICLSEPRDTTVLPCRHMCMCSECAKVLGFQTNRCPICRQPIERLLEIKVNNGGGGGGGSPPPEQEPPQKHHSQGGGF